MTDVVEATPEQITEATNMGWRPQDQYQGDPAKWVDAVTFIERGQHVMPILKENNKRLRAETEALRSQISQLTSAVQEGQAAMQALEKFHQEDLKRKVEQERTRLKEAYARAAEAGNHLEMADLTDQMTQLNATEVTPPPPPKKDDKPIQDPTQHPEYIQWVEDNPWLQDPAKQAIAHGVSIRLRQGGDRTIGRAFLDKISAETTKELQRLGAIKPPPSKVDTGNHGGSAGGGNGKKTYADLPQDAKDACEGFSRDLVGPNKRYAKKEDWQAAYAQRYFAEV